MRFIPRKLVSLAGAASLVLTAITSSVPTPLLANEPPAQTRRSMNENMKLWYTTPANINTAENAGGEWMQQSLPLGNGTLGGLIFGGISRERVHFNEKTLWTGGPTAGNPDFKFGNVTYTPEEIEAYRQVLDDKSQNVFNDTNGIGGAWFRFAGRDWNMGSYQDFGDIWLDYSPMGLKDSDAQNYRRELDLQTGIASTEFDYRQAHFTRRHFVSYPDNVMVTELEADREGRLSVDISMELNNSGLSGTRSLNQAEGMVTIEGSVKDNGLKFRTAMQIIPEGGTLEADEAAGVFHVKDADRILIVMAAETDYLNEYPVYRDTEKDLTGTVDGRVRAAGALPYETLEEHHLADHQTLFDRVELDLQEDLSDTPTDELIEASRDGAVSSYTDTLAFQFGRYLSIAGSRGVLPSNLVGLWTVGPAAWNGDYHFNVNLEMNYWPVYVTNLAECGETYVDFMDSLRAPGELTAEMVHGIEGATENHNAFTFHTQSNIFGMTSPSDAQEYGWNPAGAAWCLQNAWEYYQFTQDADYLKTSIYPILKEAAQFWDAYLWESSYQTIDDENSPYNGENRLVVAPSVSAEQGPTVNGSTYDQSLVWELYKEVITAGEICGEDPAQLEAWQNNMDRLDPINISESGGIKEWYEETRTGLVNGHFHSFASAPGLAEIQVPNSGWYIGHPGDQRHASHLVGLFPGTLINKDTPEEMSAAITSLQERGVYSTGWSKANKINLWARAGNGDMAHQILQNLIGGGSAGLQTNLFDSHGTGGGDTMKYGSPIWQIDGNYGLTAGVAEMLLQSQLGYTQFLPALPSAWSDGSVSGLKARGNFTISESWQNGAAETFTVRYDGPDALSQFIAEYPGLEEAALTDENGETVSFSVNEKGQIEFDALQNVTYTLHLDGAGQEELLQQAREVLESLDPSLENLRSELSEAIQSQSAALSSVLAKARKMHNLQAMVSEHQEDVLLLCKTDTMTVEEADGIFCRLTEMAQALQNNDQSLEWYRNREDSLRQDLSRLESELKNRTVTFDQAAGPIQSGTLLQLSGPAGFDIRFTLDGNEPTAASALYSEPIVLQDAEQITVRAALFSEGQRVSAVFSSAYSLAAAEFISVNPSWTSDWGATYAPGKMIDGNSESRWASKGTDGSEEISLELTLAKETCISTMSFDIFVSSHNCIGPYEIFARENGEWVSIASGEELAGLSSPAGNHDVREVPVRQTTTDALKVVLKPGHQEPSIWEIRAWNAQAQPVPAGSPAGLLEALETGKAADRTSQAWKDAPSELKGALESALRAFAQPDSLSQAQLDARTFFITSHLRRIGFDGTDFSALNALIAQAESVDTSLYTRSSVYELTKQLNTAKEAAADPDCTQSTADRAARTLKRALAGLQSGLTETVKIPCTALMPSGSWFQAGNFMATENTDGALTYTFTGSFLGVTTVTASDHGIMHVTIKDEQGNAFFDEQIDTYAPNRTDGALLFETSLPEGTWTVSFEKVSASPSSPSSRGWCEVGELTIVQKYTETTDRSLLEAELQRALQLDGSQYEEESWNALSQLVVQAQTLLEKPDEETCTAEMDDMASALYSARKSLLPAQTEDREANTVLLEQAIREAERLQAENALEGVNPLVKAFFENSLQQAKAVLADSTADQESVNAAWKQLVSVIQMLGFTTDKSELQALIAQAELIDLSAYEDGAEKDEFSAALLFARSVEERDDVLTSQSIAQAIERLRSAMEDLETVRRPDVQIDVTLLQWLVDRTADTDLSLYTDKTAEVFAQSLAQAQAVLAAPENQAQVDAAVADLHDAWMNLRLLPDENLLEMIRSFQAVLLQCDLQMFAQSDIDLLQSFLNDAEALLSQENPDAKSTEELAGRIPALQKIVNSTLSSDQKQDPLSGSDKKTEPDQKPVSLPAQELKTPETEDASSRSVRTSVKTAASMQRTILLLAGAASAAGLLACRKKKASSTDKKQ